jgi:hypothetical protein
MQLFTDTIRLLGRVMISWKFVERVNCDCSSCLSAAIVDNEKMFRPNVQKPRNQQHVLHTRLS